MQFYFFFGTADFSDPEISKREQFKDCTLSMQSYRVTQRTAEVPLPVALRCVTGHCVVTERPQ